MVLTRLNTHRLKEAFFLPHGLPPPVAGLDISLRGAEPGPGVGSHPPLPPG
jgi:hypothetical protein